MFLDVSPGSVNRILINVDQRHLTSQVQKQSLQRQDKISVQLPFIHIVDTFYNTDVDLEWQLFTTEHWMKQEQIIRI